MRTAWLVQRVTIAIITVLFAIILSWVLVEYSPNSPANYVFSLLSSTLSTMSSNTQLYTAMIQYLNSLRPHGNPIIGALSYIWQVLHGNFGVDLISQIPVIDIIAAALPWTLLVVITSNILSFFIGIRIGEKIAYSGGKADSAVTILLIGIRSVPIYILGVLLLFFLGFDLHIFPRGGAYSAGLIPGLNAPFIISVLYHAALPIITLTTILIPGWALNMRANTIYTLGSDYVNYAEMRGLSKGIIETAYVGKNAILPLYTSLILAIGFSFGGSVFVEQIFSYPGIGNMLLYAIENNDYPLEMGIFIMIIVAVVFGMLIADLTYSLIDPRVRVGE